MNQSREPRKRRPVHKFYFTEDYEPRQVAKVSNVAQITEGRKRSKEGNSQGTRRGGDREEAAEGPLYLNSRAEKQDQFRVEA